MAGYSSTYQLAVDIKAQGQERLKMVQREMRQTGAAARTAAENINKAFAVIKIGAAVAAVGALTKKFDELFNAGDKLGSISTNFARLTRDAEGALATLREGAMGGLKDQDLMAINNRFAGLGLTAEQTAKVINDGMRIAEASGQDFLTTIDAVGRAVATGRATALAQLGVVVDSKRAMAEYADSLGKAVTELTATEKLNARLAATGAAVNRAFGEVDMQGAIGEYEKLRVQLANKMDQMVAKAATAGDAIAAAIRGAGMASTEEQRLVNLTSDVANDLLRQAAKAKDGGKELVAAQIATIDQMIQNAQTWGAAGMDKWTGAQLQAQARFGNEAEKIVANNADKIRAEALRLSLGDKEGAIEALKAIRAETERVGKTVAGNLAQEARAKTLLEEQAAIEQERKRTADELAFKKRFASEVEESLKQKAKDRLQTEKDIATAYDAIRRTGIQIELASGRITEQEATRRTVSLDIEKALEGQSGAMGRMAAVAGVLASEALRQAKAQQAIREKEDEEAKRKAEERKSAARAAAEQRKAEAEALKERLANLERTLAEERINDQERRKILTASEAAQARHNLRTRTLFAERTTDQEKALGYQIEGLKFTAEQEAIIERQRQEELALAAKAEQDRLRQQAEARRTAERQRQEDARRAAENERYINQIRSQNAMQAALGLQAAGDLAGSQAGRVAAAFVQTNEATEQYAEAQKQSSEAAAAATPGLISASGAVTAVLLRNQRAVAWVRAAFEAAAALSSAAVGDLKGAALHGAAAAMFAVAANRSTPKASGAAISTGPVASASAAAPARATTIVVNYADNAAVRIGRLGEAGEVIAKSLNIAGQKGTKLIPKLIPAHGGYGA